MTQQIQKILVCHRVGGAFGYITDGWINALRHAGFQAARWNGERASWNRFDPDLYLGCSGHRQKIPSKKARGKCKVAIHVNPYGNPSLSGIDESPQAIDWTLSQSPNIVYGYGFEKDRHFWAHWDSSNAPWVPMATAGDATKFSPSRGSHDKFDIVYLGGRWPYKAKRIDKYLIPYLLSTSRRYAVCGWGNWPPGMCRGQLDESIADEFLASGKVGPCVSEPHTGRYGIDVPERVFKVILSGAIAVHDPVPELDMILPNLIIASNPDDFASAIDRTLAMDNRSRKQLLSEQYCDVSSAHTYHHRLAGMFKAIGFDTAAQRMLAAVKKIV